MGPCTTLPMGLRCLSTSSPSTSSRIGSLILMPLPLVRLLSFPVRRAQSFVGVIMVIFGQCLRSSAMITASTNFSHAVAYQKRATHELVTDGVYAWSRHPSYAGFFYWALGTQLVLQNPLTFIMFAYLLWRFFSQRTKCMIHLSFPDHY